MTISVQLPRLNASAQTETWIAGVTKSVESTIGQTAERGLIIAVELGLTLAWAITGLWCVKGT